MSGLFLNSKIEILNMSCFCNDLTSNTITPPIGSELYKTGIYFQKVFFNKFLQSMSSYFVASYCMYEFN